MVIKQPEDHQINYLDPNATKNLVTVLKKKKQVNKQNPRNCDELGALMSQE